MFHRAIWIGLAVLLLALRSVVLLLASTGGLGSGDGPGYFHTALHLIETAKLPPLRIQPHGYPILISPIIAAFNEHPVAAVQIFQVFLDVVLVATLGAIAWKTLAGRSVVLAGLTVVGVSIQPFTATMTNSLYTEPTNTFLLAASLLLFSRSFTKGTVPVAASFLLGLAAITRVDLIPIAVALCGAYWLIIVGQGWPLLWLSWTKERGACLVIMLLATTMPLMGLLTLQAASTGEVGVVRYEPWTPGYFAWMRTWFSNEQENTRLQNNIGQPSWEGFRLQSYPTRAFTDDEERTRIADLLKEWQAESYTTEVDQAFAAISTAKRTHAPVTFFFTIPLIRMAYFWLNLDGAQSFLRAVNIKRPYSLGIVGVTIALRVLFIALAAIGAVAAWNSRSALYLPPFLRALGQGASIMVVLRTVELGALGTFVWGGLMEIRFANITFPEVILLAVIGVRTLIDKRRSSPTIDQSWQLADDRCLYRPDDHALNVPKEVPEHANENVQ